MDGIELDTTEWLSNPGILSHTVSFPEATIQCPFLSKIPKAGKRLWRYLSPSFFTSPVILSKALLCLLFVTAAENSISFLNATYFLQTHLATLSGLVDLAHGVCTVFLFSFCFLKKSNLVKVLLSHDSPQARILSVCFTF